MAPPRRWRDSPVPATQVHCFEDGGNCKVKKAPAATPGLWQKAEKVVGVVEPALLKAAKKLRGGVVA